MLAKSSLDFTALDAWYEEDERTLGHPRDPFHRIEIVHSSRPVRVELNGAVLAESVRPYLLFESMLPVRYYLPPASTSTTGGCQPSPTRSTCAYKGHASYLSVAADRQRRRVDLPRATARGRRDKGPSRVLQRAGRFRDRRRAGRPPSDPMVRALGALTLLDESLLHEGAISTCLSLTGVPRRRELGISAIASTWETSSSSCPPEASPAISTS